MFRKTTLCIVLAFGFISNAYSESCDFLPSAMQPEWTFDSPAIEGYYVGVGLAEAEDLTANEQIEQAKQGAMGDLANSISVSVHNSLSVDIRESSGFFGSTDVEKNMRQLTETIAETSLKDVEVDATWLDRKHCIVWVRVKVSRAVVKEMERREINSARLNRLDAQYAQAKNKEITAEERDVALKQAYVLLDEIDFEVLPGQSKRYYQRMLDSLKTSLTKKVSARQEAEKLREQAEALLLRAGSTSDADQRKTLMVEAIAKLKAIVAANPIGEREQMTAGEAALFKVAEVEKSRNNACEAQLQYEIVRDRSKSAEWTNKATQMLETVKCTRKDRKTRAWRKAFDGIQTSFICARDLQDDVDDWDKPCENVASFLQSYGALSAADVSMDSRDIAKLAYQLDNNATAAKEKLAGRGRVLIFVARGKIKHRDNPENPMGQDHQFSGKIYSYLIENGSVEFRDEYTGTGGWNPVSEEMAMEVLGLNVSKRWQSKYFEHIKNN